MFSGIQSLLEQYAESSLFEKQASPYAVDRLAGNNLLIPNISCHCRAVLLNVTSREEQAGVCFLQLQVSCTKPILRHLNDIPKHERRHRIYTQIETAKISTASVDNFGIHLILAISIRH